MRRKKLMSILMGVTMLTMSLTACGGGGSTPNTPVTTADSGSKAETKAEAKTEEPVTLVFQLSGGISGCHCKIRRGAQL